MGIKMKNPHIPYDRSDYPHSDVKEGFYIYYSPAKYLHENFINSVGRDIIIYYYNPDESKLRWQRELIDCRGEGETTGWQKYRSAKDMTEDFSVDRLNGKSNLGKFYPLIYKSSYQEMRECLENMEFTTMILKKMRKLKFFK